MMRRTQIQLDEVTWTALRRAAYERGTSMSSVVRETLAGAFEVSERKKKAKPRSARLLSVVGIGRSADEDLKPVSVNHDDAFVEAVMSRFRTS
jgi:hypothetical protein